MKKCLLCLLVFLYAVSGCGGAKREAEKPLIASPEGVSVYLLAGMDNAAGNTDMLGILSHDSRNNTLSVLQIPRDSYLFFGGSQNKINQLYPIALSGTDGSTEGRKAAMRSLCDTVSSVFGIPLDGYMALSLDDLRTVVDAVGGIALDLPVPFSYHDSEKGSAVELPTGRQRLNGEAAVQFVRHRAGYLQADLGRVDAQKLFLSAFLAQIRSNLSLGSAASLFSALYGNVLTEVPLTELLGQGVRLATKLSETETVFMTLPGEAVRREKDSGLWYYAVNRAAAAEMLKAHFPFGGKFDPNGKMTDKACHEIDRVYRKKGMKWRVYTQGQLEELSILPK